MDVAHRLREKAAEIAARATHDVYRNPFWLARYGEAGRAYVLEDARHHLDHLARAVECGGVRLMRDYARWLQTVLTTRGMCTRHLDDNLSSIAGHAAAAVPDAQAPVATIVAAARDALRYADDGARRVQEAAPEIAREIVSELRARGRFEEEAVRARCLDDLGYHLSYLADSIALRRSELFVEHVVFVDGFLRTLDHPAADLDETLALLGDVVCREHSVGGDVQRHVRERIDKALEALRLSREATA